MFNKKLEKKVSVLERCKEGHHGYAGPREAMTATQVAAENACREGHHGCVSKIGSRWCRPNYDPSSGMTRLETLMNGPRWSGYPHRQLDRKSVV